MDVFTPLQNFVGSNTMLRYKLMIINLFKKLVDKYDRGNTSNHITHNWDNN